MMSIVYLFWMFVILFGIVGWMRGWAKELLVSFSVILALGLNHVLRRYIPIAQGLPETDESLFWVRTIILLVLVYFGYQTVISISHLASKAARERLQDTLFGGIMGGESVSAEGELRLAKITGRIGHRHEVPLAAAEFDHPAGSSVGERSDAEIAE